ncbi:MAG: hypothetical protein CMM25_06495 [Rhodospirillaceae bacterium]|nr:hypothetical protein [Rhodospirillaceae bacterium]
MSLEKTVMDNSDTTTELRDYIVDYVGNLLNPEDNQVTVEMIINVLADELPEVVLPLVEENYIRGYEQGLEDLRSFEDGMK